MKARKEINTLQWRAGERDGGRDRKERRESKITRENKGFENRQENGAKSGVRLRIKAA